MKSSIGDSLSAISIIITAIYDIIKSIRGFLYRMSTYWKNRKIKNKYKKGEKAVENGNVDDINDIITK